MYRLAKTFIKVAQATPFPLGPAAVGTGIGLLGGTIAYGASEWLKNPSNTKALTNIPGNVWKNTQTFANNIGNTIKPLNNTKVDTYKPGNWTNTAAPDNTVAQKFNTTAIVPYKGNASGASGENSQSGQKGPNGNWWETMKKFGKRAALLGTGAGILTVGDGISNLNKSSQENIEAVKKNQENLNSIKEKNKMIDSIGKLPVWRQDQISDSIKNLRKF